MGFRFRKNIKIAPGVKLNLNKKSVGLTAGVKGAHVSINSSGKRTKTVGIPETGISYTTSKGGKLKQMKKAKNTVPNQNNNSTGNQAPTNNDSKKWYQKTGWIILLLVLFFPVGLYLLLRYTDWSTKTKGVVTGVVALVVAYSLLTSPSSSVPNTPATSDTEIASKTEITGAETNGSEILPESAATASPSPTLDPTPVPTQEPTTEPTTMPIEDTQQVAVVEAPTDNTSENNTTAQSAETALSENETNASTNAIESTEGSTQTQDNMVWIASSGKGKTYHNDPTCSNMVSPNEISLDKAETLGLTPCEKCY